MALKSYNPTSPARRALILVDKSSLWKGKPVKALTEGKHKTGGRNNKGHVTSRGIAGGHKQKYRFIDFKRRKWDQPAVVERLEYDPNRTAFIALIKYADGEQAYILAPQRLAVGDSVVAGEKTDVKPGNAMLLSQMPVGTICHNVEMKPGKGGQIARSAWSSPASTRASSAICAAIAWVRLVRFPTPTTRTRTSARPAALAGRAAAR
jgi:large subunit ribosomal protein L2